MAKKTLPRSSVDWAEMILPPLTDHSIGTTNSLNQRWCNHVKGMHFHLYCCGRGSAGWNYWLHLSSSPLGDQGLVRGFISILIF